MCVTKRSSQNFHIDLAHIFKPVWIESLYICTAYIHFSHLHSKENTFLPWQLERWLPTAGRCLGLCCEPQRELGDLLNYVNLVQAF